MSGVFGIVRPYGQQVDEAELAGMSGVMQHRGPNGIRYHLQGNVGFGHCMLHSTPESLHEVLPIHDTLSKLLMTADARIDNREELLAAIGADRPLRETWLDAVE